MINKNKKSEEEKILRKESKGFVASLENKEKRNELANKVNIKELAELRNLEIKYNNLKNKYSLLQENINKNSLNSVERMTDKNKYSNKNVLLLDGSKGYVTDFGTYKMYDTDEIFDKTSGMNGCPSSSSMINTAASIDGDIVTTNPTLLVGSKMRLGQACGNEGKNVYASELVKNIKTDYLGCYDDSNRDAMEFIGDKPPAYLYESSIENGNFVIPLIKNNSFKTISSETEVPGWNFNAVLLNNSVAWRYPIPYPSGNQCVSIQTTQHISQFINVNIGFVYEIIFNSVGRNCCDKSRLGNTISILIDNEEIEKITPPIEGWKEYKIRFMAKKNRVELKFKGLWDKTDRSSAIQGIMISQSDENVGKGNYSYEMCKIAALEKGYKYYGLEMMNVNTGKGYCAVSNDEVSIKSKGISYRIKEVIPLWISEVSANTGVGAKITPQGTLQIIDNSGKSVYSTVNDSKIPSTYRGCYNDDEKRRLPVNLGKKTFKECQQEVEKSNLKYFGLQNGDVNGISDCWGGVNLAKATVLGKANNCIISNNNVYTGTSWSNAIYNVKNAVIDYYLILEDDGSMTINRGSSPEENQGEVWNSGTKGKQVSPNVKMSAINGKYGRNWIRTNEVLGVGDFVGSPNGYIYLIFQQDRRLVLNSSKREESCVSVGNIIGGDEKGVGLYKFEEIGNRSLIGKLGYINNDSILREYPEEMLELSNNYEILEDRDLSGNDMKSVNASNIEECKIECNKNEKCGGFVYQGSTNNCVLKSSSKGEKLYNMGYMLGIRKPQIKNGMGCGKDIIDIDTINYGKYVKGNNMEINGECEVPIVSSKDIIMLDNIKNELSILGEEIALKMENLYNRNNEIYKNMNMNSVEFKKKVDDYKKTRLMLEKGLSIEKRLGIEKNDVYTKKNVDNIIEGMKSNLNTNDIKGMLDDSELIAIHENYRYILWSMVVVCALTITLNVIKK